MLSIPSKDRRLTEVLLLSSVRTVFELVVGSLNKSNPYSQMWQKNKTFFVRSSSGNNSSSMCLDWKVLEAEGVGLGPEGRWLLLELRRVPGHQWSLFSPLSPLGSVSSTCPGGPCLPQPVLIRSGLLSCFMFDPPCRVPLRLQQEPSGASVNPAIGSEVRVAETLVSKPRPAQPRRKECVCVCE